MNSLREWCVTDSALIPREREISEQDFVEYLVNIFDQHRNALRNIQNDQIVRSLRDSQGMNKIADLSCGIIRAVKEYLLGHPAYAYNELRDALGHVKDHLSYLESDMPDITAAQSLPLYRMREFENNYSPQSKYELFHIPFTLRGYVSSQRYSINGLPCFYLGSSLSVCWNELGKPDLARLYAIKLRFRNIPRILNIPYVSSFMPSIIDLWEQNGPNRARFEAILIALLVCWPLIAACTIRTLHPDDKFKPEYIVPQLLLQWITKEKQFSGIRYLSTKITEPSRISKEVNYVFPALTSSATGHCQELIELFDLTDPIGLQDINLSDAVFNPAEQRFMWP